MNQLPFDTVGLAAEEVANLEASYKLLKTNFHTDLSDGFNTHINKFELFNNNAESTIGGSFIINAPQNTSCLTFVKNHFSVSAGGRGSGSVNAWYDKYQLWAFVTSTKNFGRVLIRRKTLTDGILELINHVELKIDGDRAFNAKYHVVTNDSQKAVEGLCPEFRAVLMAATNDKLIIEIINNTLAIGSYESIDPEQVISLANLANSIASVV